MPPRKFCHKNARGSDRRPQDVRGRPHGQGSAVAEPAPVHSAPVQSVPPPLCGCLAALFRPAAPPPLCGRSRVVVAAPRGRVCAADRSASVLHGRGSIRAERLIPRQCSSCRRPLCGLSGGAFSPRRAAERSRLYRRSLCGRSRAVKNKTTDCAKMFRIIE